MNNKDYLDKVVRSLVRSTNIDYENDRITIPFSIISVSDISSIPIKLFNDKLIDRNVFHIQVFHSYCRRFYGLTGNEIPYVWKEYRDIIIEKISNGE